MKSKNKSWKKSGENVIAKDMFCYHGNREGNRGKNGNHTDTIIRD